MKPFRNLLVVYSSFVALCAAVVLGSMLVSPSEPGNSVMLGLSLPRLVLALGLLFAFVVFVWITIKAAKDQGWVEQFLNEWFGRGRFSGVAGWLGGISFGLGGIGLFVPPYFWGRYEAYLVRIQPVMVFILLAGIATLVLLYVRRRKSTFTSQVDPKIVRLGMILCVICLLVLLGMLLSGFGIHSKEDFWYGAGVPVLLSQLTVAVAFGMLFLQFEKKWSYKYFDLFVFLLIFVVTAFLWAREPLQRGFSFIIYPPNNELYPLYDAAVFDMGGQFPLIGQRVFIYGTYFFERPLYPVFLFYLHALFGQDYGLMMAVQAAIFAVFPALVYLIGKSLNLRSVGFAAALVTMFRGVNAIAASNMIDLANAKMILTDFPAAIGVALVVLAVCEWLKQPSEKIQYALWIGGALGFTLMLRVNALMLLALIPFYALFRFAKNWKIWLLHSSLMVLAMVAITLPWELRNRSLGGQMYGPIITKFKAVIDTRYTSPLEPQLPVTQSVLVLSTLYRGNISAQQGDTACGSVACFVPNHFLHNIVTSVLILPTSPVMDDLRHTVKGNNPYWNPKWDGTFTFPALFWFAINLFLITLGIASAWRQRRLPGLAPLAIFFFYNLSNAFARTSGGRYIVPMDWIITIYFLLGIFQIIVWVAQSMDVQWSPGPDHPNQDPIRVTSVPKSFSKVIFVILALLGLGSLLPLSENIFSQRYQNLTSGQVLAEKEGLLKTAGLDIPVIESFLQNDGAEILIGRALYPRYFRKDQQEAVFFPIQPLFYPRTTFDLIGPAGKRSVVLPGDIPQRFPHASDVIVIGCKGQSYFDALAVIILGETNALYTRSPESELTCPLRQPVCDNNSVCK